MKEVISKELLSEVSNHTYNIRIERVFSSAQEPNMVMYAYVIDNILGVKLGKINIYELAFLTRDYLHKEYGYSLDMSLEIGEIFKNATQFYESIV